MWGNSFHRKMRKCLSSTQILMRAQKMLHKPLIRKLIFTELCIIHRNLMAFQRNQVGIALHTMKCRKRLNRTSKKWKSKRTSLRIKKLYYLSRQTKFISFPILILINQLNPKCQNLQKRRFCNKKMEMANNKKNRGQQLL